MEIVRNSMGADRDSMNINVNIMEIHVSQLKSHETYEDQFGNQ